MTARRSDGSARSLLSLMILLGIGLLVIPLSLTPPAFLEITLHDAVFHSDLAKQSVRLTDETGTTRIVTSQKVDNDFIVPVGRIKSGLRSYTVNVAGYQAATAPVNSSPMQTVRVPVALTPTFGRLELAMANATLPDELVPATVKEGNTVVVAEPQRVVTLSLPPGKHLLSAQASGFCPTEREFDVRAGNLTKASFPLSPDLTGDEIARFVLSWGENPRDLDAHFIKLDPSGPSNASHVYYGHKEGRTAATPESLVFARLDADHTHSYGPETITVLGAADGDFEYLIHLYAGDGTLGASGARVEVFTRGCQRKTYLVPSDCGLNTWAVAHVSIHHEGIELLDRQTCESAQRSGGAKKLAYVRGRS